MKQPRCPLARQQLKSHVVAAKRPIPIHLDKRLEHFVNQCPSLLGACPARFRGGEVNKRLFERATQTGKSPSIVDLPVLRQRIVKLDNGPNRSCGCTVQVRLRNRNDGCQPGLECLCTGRMQKQKSSEFRYSGIDATARYTNSKRRRGSRPPPTELRSPAQEQGSELRPCHGLIPDRSPDLGFYTACFIRALRRHCCGNEREGALGLTATAQSPGNAA